MESGVGQQGPGQTRQPDEDLSARLWGSAPRDEESGGGPKNSGGRSVGAGESVRPRAAGNPDSARTRLLRLLASACTDNLESSRRLAAGVAELRERVEALAVSGSGSSSDYVADSGADSDSGSGGRQEDESSASAGINALFAGQAATPAQR